jgi:hypothetical protein
MTKTFQFKSWNSFCSLIWVTYHPFRSSSCPLRAVKNLKCLIQLSWTNSYAEGTVIKSSSPLNLKAFRNWCMETSAPESWNIITSKWRKNWDEGLCYWKTVNFMRSCILLKMINGISIPEDRLKFSLIRETACAIGFVGNFLFTERRRFDIKVT